MELVRLLNSLGSQIAPASTDPRHSIDQTVFEKRCRTRKTFDCGSPVSGALMQDGNSREMLWQVGRATRRNQPLCDAGARGHPVHRFAGGLGREQRRAVPEARRPHPGRDRRLPWLTSPGSRNEHPMTDPVLIVGAGPAASPPRLGVAERLIEKAPKPATTSRAIGVQARTLGLLHQRGLADEMVRLGNPAHGGSVYGDGKRIFRLDLGNVDSRLRLPAVHFSVRDRTHPARGDRQQGVEIERGVELIGIAQDALSHDASPVTAILRHPRRQAGANDGAMADRRRRRS